MGIKTSCFQQLSYHAIISSYCFKQIREVSICNVSWMLFNIISKYKQCQDHHGGTPWDKLHNRLVLHANVGKSQVIFRECPHQLIKYAVPLLTNRKAIRQILTLTLSPKFLPNQWLDWLIASYGPEENLEHPFQYRVETWKGGKKPCLAERDQVAAFQETDKNCHKNQNVNKKLILQHHM